MLCLGVETSCDETGVALVRDGRLVAEKLASQAELHAVFGGVVPEMAGREHLRLLGPLLDGLWRDSGCGPGDVDAVAAARGPGLLGSLLVGMGLAKGLALATGATFLGVNHLHAHLLAPGLTRQLVFPALGLLVSGGHTHIYLVRSPFEFELLGRTLDDAAGEAFDKAAKLLNLPYPGGAHIDRLARNAEPDRDMFPRPYIDNNNIDFSFSGLKTAAANYLAERPELRLPKLVKADEVAGHVRARPELAVVCASFNWAVADTLRIKTERALKKAPQARSLIVAGGVAANSMVRRTANDLAAEWGLPLFIPEPSLCTDNAAMVAYTGWLLARAGRFHRLDLDAVPRGRKVPDDFEIAS